MEHGPDFLVETLLEGLQKRAPTRLPEIGTNLGDLQKAITVLYSIGLCL